MFILFGTKTRAKVVDGGRRGPRRCASCDKSTEWVECLVKDSFNVFFIDVLDSTARCMRCVECGDECAIEDWDREEKRRQITAAPAALSAPVSERPSKPAVDYDKEFAALKARLGKK